MRSRTRARGAERRAETAVFGRLFLQRMHHYRVLAKDNVPLPGEDEHLIAAVTRTFFPHFNTIPPD
jgi:hypothetical protein